jgi:hypothetical protein
LPHVFEKTDLWRLREPFFQAGNAKMRIGHLRDTAIQDDLNEHDPPPPNRYAT